MNPEANESPPPTRSTISTSRWATSWNWPWCQQMAPQPLTLAERAVRRVVAMVVMLGNAATTSPIIFRKAAVGSSL